MKFLQIAVFQSKYTALKSESAISFSYKSAVYLDEIDLWLDPHRPKPFALVSHAHADHVAAHK